MLTPYTLYTFYPYSLFTSEILLCQGCASKVSNKELLKVIADFLLIGYVENIIAMFKQKPRYYQGTGELLDDGRYAVRLGVPVLFEYLVSDRSGDVHISVPSRTRALQHETSWVREEAVSVLAGISNNEATGLIKPMEDDPAPQVAAIACDILSKGNL